MFALAGLAILVVICVYALGSISIGHIITPVPTEPKVATALPAAPAAPAAPASNGLPAAPAAPAASAVPEAAAAPAATSTPTANEPIIQPPATGVTIGSKWISPKDGMTLMFVPEGKFLMGSNHSDSDEKPIHLVWLDSYWIDQTDVTNAMYTKCVSMGGCQVSGCAEDSNFNGINQPVVCVDWNQANNYCLWAGRHLPSEAQWEKGARGINGQTYPWGSQPPSNSLLNYNDQIGRFSNKLGKTTDVNSFPKGASPYGVLDMAGNVSQWVYDWYSETYYQSETTWQNPVGPSTGQVKVIRGSSFYDDNGSNVQRSSHRYTWVKPDTRVNSIGFRCSE